MISISWNKNNNKTTHWFSIRLPQSRYPKLEKSTRIKFIYRKLEMKSWIGAKNCNESLLKHTHMLVDINIEEDQQWQY